MECCEISRSTHRYIQSLNPNDTMGRKKRKRYRQLACDTEDGEYVASRIGKYEGCHSGALKSEPSKSKRASRLVVTSAEHILGGVIEEMGHSSTLINDGSGRQERQVRYHEEEAYTNEWIQP